MRSLRKVVSAICLLVLVVGSLMARSSADSDGEPVRVEGRILLKGSMPLVRIVLQTEDGQDYLLTGYLAEELAGAHRLKQVLIVGTLTDNSDLPPEIEVHRYRLKE